MEQLLQQANAAGLDSQQSKDVLGGVLSLLKNNLSSEDFGKIQQAIPETESLVEETETKSRAGNESGGANALLSSAMGMLGGGGVGASSSASGGASGGMQNAPQLLTFLSGLGIDQKQITKFMPMIAQFLQKNAGVDTASTLGVSGQSTSQTTSSGGSDLASQAASFLGGFGK